MLSYGASLRDRDVVNLREDGVPMLLLGMAQLRRVHAERIGT